MENTNSEIPNITFTIIFDGSALNRDEKIGGNILSIKKLTYHGKVRPFISKNAIRHYLFSTLNKWANWKKTPIILQGSENKTLQLDLTKADILTSEELAVFGYMFTKSGEGALTRKSPLGITKALGLSNYNQDLAFYTNHDFVERFRETGKNAQPNPLNKEEHCGLFKVTFTIDTDKMGEDTWVVDDYSFSSNQLKIKIAEPQKFIFGNCFMKKDEDDNIIGYEVKKNENDSDGAMLYVNGLKLEISKNLVRYSKTNKTLTLKPDFASDRKEDTDKRGKKVYKSNFKFKVTDPEENKDNETFTFECTYEPMYNLDNKTLTLKLGHEKRIDNVNCESYNKNSPENVFESDNNKIKVLSLNQNRPENGPFNILFKLSKENKNKIIDKLLFVIKNGLIAHSSGESNTIVPLFMIAGAVKVPSPIFHSFIDVKKNDKGEFEVYGVKDALKNGWLINKIFIEDTERLVYPGKSDINENLTTNWDSFLESLNLK